MKITANNHYTDAYSGFSVTSDAKAGQTIADIETGDFSTAYTSNGIASTFVIDKTFSSAFTCRYVAIAGHNFGALGGTLTLVIDTVTKGTTTFTAGDSNHVILFHFASLSATNIKLTFTKGTSTDACTVTYVAAGDLLDSEFSIPTNEESGFSKVWRTRSKKLRATLSDSGAPVAYIRQSISRNATLSFSSMEKSVIDSALWNSFLGLIYDTGDFFIKEEDGDTTGVSDNPKSSYLCFDADAAPPRTHGSTRALVQQTIKYKAYTGL